MRIEKRSGRDEDCWCLRCSASRVAVGTLQEGECVEFGGCYYVATPNLIKQGVSAVALESRSRASYLSGEDTLVTRVRVTVVLEDE
jgi:hypothetical protein